MYHVLIVLQKWPTQPFNANQRSNGLYTKHKTRALFWRGFGKAAKMAEKQSVKQMLSKDYISGKLSDTQLLERLDVSPQAPTLTPRRNYLSFF